MDKCFYCQKEASVEAFRNPITKEIHLTCEQCRNSLSLFIKERLFLSKAIFALPLFILGTIVLIFFDWHWGLFGLILCIILEIISIRLLSHYNKKVRIGCGTYVDPHNIRWCETCKSYRKVKGFDDLADGIWANEQLPDSSYIPCKIIDETIGVWKSFFALDRGKRALFPKDCPKWTKR